MIFAEKLIKLRKQQGWSQEELAAQLDVTRQSVSKWESMTSIPDLDKIVKLSQIFGVSTDYLLKDDEQLPMGEILPAEPLADSEPAVRPVDLEEANSYLEQVRRSALKIAAGVAICILCPIPVILLWAMFEQPGSGVTEAMATGIGVGCLFLMIAAAVALFILEGFRLDRYEYLDKDPIVTEYGVAGIAERRRETYEPVWRRSIVVGVICCILAVVPLIVVGAFHEENEVLQAWMVALMLGLIAAGVFLMVRSGMIWESFHKLLEENEYTREKKLQNRKNGPMTAIYWSLVTAVYLGWSFITCDWGRTWIIWPVAGVLFGTVTAIANAVRNRQTH